MNEHEVSIGPLMKAARKFRKFNQSDVADAIGCSQSALSKMEHNLLVPSAPQWFLFARFTAIPPETLETGFIDRHS
jgi:transcriptional regulator with XRE-family HTH domain